MPETNDSQVPPHMYAYLVMVAELRAQMRREDRAHTYIELLPCGVADCSICTHAGQQQLAALIDRIATEMRLATPTRVRCPRCTYWYPCQCAPDDGLLTVESNVAQLQAWHRLTGCKCPADDDYGLISGPGPATPLDGDDDLDLTPLTPPRWLCDELGVPYEPSPPLNGPQDAQPDDRRVQDWQAHQDHAGDGLAG